MISFCIPAHNEAAYLPATLRAIHDSARALAIAPGDYEIVLADDASTDDTGALATAQGARVIPIQARQIAAARNAAARAAAGDPLIFLDADTRLNPDALRAMLGALRRGAVGGGCLVRFDPPIPWWAHAAMPPIILMFRVSKLTGGACMFCTRAAFSACGGWNERYFASEEIHFAGALKGVGPFVVPMATVETSGRKLRTHGWREIFGMLVRMAMAGPEVAVQNRDLLDLWYGERRAEA